MAYFPEVEKIAFEGPDADNPLAFRHYNPEEIVEGAPARVGGATSRRCRFLGHGARI